MRFKVFMPVLLLVSASAWSQNHAESVNYLERISQLEQQIELMKKQNELDLVRKQGGQAMPLPRIVSISAFDGQHQAVLKYENGVRRKVKTGDSIGKNVSVTAINRTGVSVNVQGNKSVPLEFEPPANAAPGGGVGVSIGSVYYPPLPIVRPNFPPLPSDPSPAPAPVAMPASQVQQQPAVNVQIQAPAQTGVMPQGLIPAQPPALE